MELLDLSRLKDKCSYRWNKSLALEWISKKLLSKSCRNPIVELTHSNKECYTELGFFSISMTIDNIKHVTWKWALLDWIVLTTIDSLQIKLKLLDQETYGWSIKVSWQCFKGLTKDRLLVQHNTEAMIKLNQHFEQLRASNSCLCLYSS